MKPIVDFSSKWFSYGTEGIVRYKSTYMDQLAIYAAQTIRFVAEMKRRSQNLGNN